MTNKSSGPQPRGKIDKQIALASVGAKLWLAKGVTLLAKFDGEFASRAQAYAGTGNCGIVGDRPHVIATQPCRLVAHMRHRAGASAWRLYTDTVEKLPDGERG
jgi:hypothetical protein